MDTEIVKQLMFRAYENLKNVHNVDLKEIPFSICEDDTAL